MGYIQATKEIRICKKVVGASIDCPFSGSMLTNFTPKGRSNACVAFWAWAIALHPITVFDTGPILKFYISLGYGSVRLGSVLRGHGRSKDVELLAGEVPIDWGPNVFRPQGCVLPG